MGQFNTPIESPKETYFVDHEKEINEFLGDEKSHIDEHILTQIQENAKAHEKMILTQIEQGEGERDITYNKYKKEFLIDGERATIGEIIASRHHGTSLSLPVKGSSFEEKRLHQLYVEHHVRDILTSEANKALAEALVKENEKKDHFISRAYSKIAEGKGTESEQLGVLAEKLMIGVAETIAIDRPDLHLVIRSANAYQDVADKIDFIISTKTKKRGVGVDTKESGYDEKNFGIQFTLNTSKKEFKEDQIAKSKARGLDVDDILLVYVEQDMLAEAIKEWKEKGSSHKGPWSKLHKNTQHNTLRTLFGGILTEEEIETLIK